VSTVASIWGVLNGKLSAASKLTLIVTGSATAIFFLLWVLYKHILLRNAKKKHIDDVGHLGLGQHGEGRIQAKEYAAGFDTKILNNVSHII